MSEPKILLWDIETSLESVAVFSLRNQDWIHPSNILQERYIICYSYQWLGDDKVHSVSVLDDPKLFAKDPHSDKHVMTKLHELLSEADAVVHHNGNAFDLKFSETRMLAHGLTPLPIIPHIDTLKTAKTRFFFNSNSLEYLGTLLGVGHKLDHSKGLWLTILKEGNSPKAVKAIKEMVKYNKQDVLLLRDVFLKLRPYMPDYMSRHLFGNPDSTCPRCGSHHVQKRGIHRALTQLYQRFQCSKCGGWFRVRKSSGRTETRIL